VKSLSTSGRVVNTLMASVVAVTGAIVPLLANPAAVAAADCETPVLSSRVVTSSPGDHTITSEISWKYRYYCSNPYQTPTQTAVTRIYTKVVFNESESSVVHELRYAAIHHDGDPVTLHASFPVWEDYSISMAARCTGTCSMSRYYYPRNSSGGLIWMTASRDNFARVWCGCHTFPVGDTSEALWHFYSRDTNKLKVIYLSNAGGCSSGWCP
jgi:hypothetical protein